MIFISIVATLYVYNKYGNSKLETLESSAEAMNVTYKNHNKSIGQSILEIDNLIDGTRLALENELSDFDSLLATVEGQKVNLDKSIEELQNNIGDFDTYEVENFVSKQGNDYKSSFESFEESAFTSGLRALNIKNNLSILDTTNAGITKGARFYYYNLREYIDEIDSLRQLTKSGRRLISGRLFGAGLDNDFKLIDRRITDIKVLADNYKTGLDSFLVERQSNLNAIQKEYEQVSSDLSKLGADANYLKNSITREFTKTNDTLNYSSTLAQRAYNGTLTMKEQSNQLNSYFNIHNSSRQIDNLMNHLKRKLSKIEVSKDSIANSVNQYNLAKDSRDSVSNIALRYGIVIFLVFIIQLLLSFNKYHYRLAAFYDTKADALSVKNDFSDLTSRELFELLDSSEVQFGRQADIYKRAFEVFREFVNKSDIKPK
ncbi:MAG: hypothetical protein NXI20_10250 [bacterium]|nr:hypothetical protein [bacterium]